MSFANDKFEVISIGNHRNFLSSLAEGLTLEFFIESQFLLTDVNYHSLIGRLVLIAVRNTDNERSRGAVHS
jgi:hypothetical protein